MEKKFNFVKGDKNPSYKHGMSRTRQFGIWTGMKNRCNRKTAINYKQYGGRGISYDPRWNDFIVFWDDMGKDYKDDLTLDRVDNDANYYKENCRWISQKEQCQNRSTNKYITFEGKTMTITQWNEFLLFPANVLGNRITRRKWPLEKALTQPLEIHIKKSGIR